MPQLILSIGHAQGPPCGSHPTVAMVLALRPCPLAFHIGGFVRFSGNSGGIRLLLCLQVEVHLYIYIIIFLHALATVSCYSAEEHFKMEDQTSSTAAMQLTTAESYIQVAMHADSDD